MIPALWMCPANERRRYIVTSSLIGLAIHKMIPALQQGQSPVQWVTQTSSCHQPRTGNSRQTAIDFRCWVGQVCQYGVCIIITICRWICMHKLGSDRLILIDIIYAWIYIYMDIFPIRYWGKCFNMLTHCLLSFSLQRCPESVMTWPVNNQWWMLLKLGLLIFH